MNVVLVNQVEWNWARLIQVVFCVAMAAGMDLDHMIEARSLHIEVRRNIYYGLLSVVTQKLVGKHVRLLPANVHVANQRETTPLIRTL